MTILNATASILGALATAAILGPLPYLILDTLRGAL